MDYSEKELAVQAIMDRFSNIEKFGGGGVVPIERVESAIRDAVSQNFEQVNSLQEEINKLQKKIDELEDENSELEDRVEKLEEEVEDLQEEVSESMFPEEYELFDIDKPSIEDSRKLELLKSCWLNLSYDELYDALKSMGKKI